MITTVWAPETEVAVGNRRFRVVEMAWPDALELCKLLADGVVKASKPDDGETAKPLAQMIHDAAVESETVIEHVLSCCLVLPEGEDVRRLPASVMVRVVSAALDLTLNDEVLAAGNGLAQRLTRALGKNQLPGVTPSIS